MSLLVAVAIGVLAFPEPLFGYSMSYGNYRVRSDRPIDPAMARVLDDVTRRLRTSDLHDPDAVYRIFICNEPWRFWIYTRNTVIGGSADTFLTRNIYIRQADIASNRVIPPSGRLADAEVRSLAYFIAHEATHVMQSRAFGRLVSLRYPDWLTEGHADLVAKAGDFDAAENRRLLRMGDPRLDYRRSGLYRGYHLIVATLIRQPGVDIRRLFAAPPDEAAVMRILLRPDRG